MKFTDRKAAKPNRYKIIPENGGDPYYVTLERADAPTEEGTPINASVMNVLASAVSLSEATKVE